jgi:hypothetical protein
VRTALHPSRFQLHIDRAESTVFEKLILHQSLRNSHHSLILRLLRVVVLISVPFHSSSYLQHPEHYDTYRDSSNHQSDYRSDQSPLSYVERLCKPRALKILLDDR